MIHSNDYSQAVANTSTRVLEPNPNRVYASFVNDSDTVQYISFDKTAVSNTGIRLNANGGSYEINRNNPFYGFVEAINSAGSKILLVTELSYD